jgi:hypothetical protein
MPASLFLLDLFCGTSKYGELGTESCFFAYAFLLPISTYYYGYLNYFPSFAILISTLIPLFLLLALNLWITTDSNEKFETLKKIMNPNQIFYMLALLISTQWVLSFLFHYLLSTDDVFIAGYLSLFILIFFYELLPREFIQTFGRSCITHGLWNNNFPNFHHSLYTRLRFAHLSNQLYHELELISIQ